jgi:hypothetical protein
MAVQVVVVVAAAAAAAAVVVVVVVAAAAVAAVALVLGGKWQPERASSRRTGDSLRCTMAIEERAVQRICRCGCIRRSSRTDTGVDTWPDGSDCVGGKQKRAARQSGTRPISQT